MIREHLATYMDLEDSDFSDNSDFSNPDIYAEMEQPNQVPTNKSSKKRKASDHQKDQEES